MNPWQPSPVLRVGESEEYNDFPLYSRDAQRRQGHGWRVHVKREAKIAATALVAVRQRQQALGVDDDDQGSSLPPRALQRAIDFYISTNEHNRFMTARPVTSLWPHQQRGAEFMRERERDGSPNGGIIAYKMRAGKTLMIAAAILEDLQALVLAGGRRFGEPTLFVVPKQALVTIASEFDKHFGGKEKSPLNVVIISSKHPFIAQSMNWTQELVGSYDVIITSYSLITASYSRTERERDPGEDLQTLLDLRYRRVVADEAHVFCNKENKLFRAMMAIDARFRWFVTGTPIRNSASDLLSPMAFLRVPTEEAENVESAAFRALLQRVMIRQVDLEPVDPENAPKAPVIDDQVVKLDFASAIERRFYTAAQTKTQELLKTTRGRTKGREVASKLTLILRLRQICADPHLLAMLASNAVRTQYVFERYGAETWSVDGFLHDVLTAEDLSAPNSDEAPLSSDPRNVLLDNMDTSMIKRRLARIVPLVATKIRYILRYYEEFIENTNEKLIVFSSWAGFVERMGRVFTKRADLRGMSKVSHLVVHGKIEEDRDQLFDVFRHDNSYNVLFITTGTGSVSLDLSCASHVIIADLWFNPFAEEQSISRVLGHNQLMPIVRIRRLCMRGTIDEEILRLHATKLNLQNLLPGHVDEKDKEPGVSVVDAKAMSFLVAWILKQGAVAEDETVPIKKRGMKRKYRESEDDTSIISHRRK